MTMFETMIVLAVIGLMMVVGYMGVRHVRKSDLREDTNRIAATLRVAYTRAIQSGLPHRVVFDLDEQKYSVEVCEPGARMSASSEDDEEDEDKYEGMAPDEIVAEKRAEILSELGDQVAGDRAEDMAGALASQDAACQAAGIAGQLRKDIGIEVEEVWVQHFEEAQKDGRATVHFFPIGYAEKAVVVVANDDDDSYSLVVSSMTGRVEIQSGELEDPEAYMTHNALGDEAPER